MKSKVLTEFPPYLTPGNRVWTMSGFANHGRIEGSKIDIPPNMGGTIIGTEKPYGYMDRFLYTIEWDDGQIAKHYSNKLFGIGRFKTLKQFSNAVRLAIDTKVPVLVQVGPHGGFRNARMNMSLGNESKEIEIYERNLWQWMFQLAGQQLSIVETQEQKP